ncbi:MAG: DNA mismatch repair endonuclease MutH [Pseudomonadota bacterium]
MTVHLSAPETQAVLLTRAEALAGFTMAELAEKFNQPLPKHLLHAKGWFGQLLEKALGADAGNLPVPDFRQLAIELKTIPIDNSGKPLETTYVCVVPLKISAYQTWRQSNVYRKLKHVLWIPYQGCRDIPIAERIIGMPKLWQPNTNQENLLRQDWQEHMEKIKLGQIDSITAHHGEVLQIRPKAANANAKTTAIDEFGQLKQTLPRGFYLRTQFTAEILRN